MQGNLNLAVNSADCMVESSGWGFKVFTNVCTNATIQIPWGPGEWVTAVCAGALLTLLFGLAAAFLVAIFYEGKARG